MLMLQVDAPAKLKRDIDAVLNLQAELDSIHAHFARVQKAISEGDKNPEATQFLDSLRRTHERTQSKVEGLYTSLNVTDSFPEIQGLPLEFVRTLLMARDLKITIRKRATGTFFEWDRLDSAAGGRDQPLGKLVRNNVGIINEADVFQEPNSINKPGRPSRSELLLS